MASPYFLACWFVRASYKNFTKILQNLAFGIVKLDLRSLLIMELSKSVKNCPSGDIWRIIMYFKIHCTSLDGGTVYPTTLVRVNWCLRYVVWQRFALSWVLYARFMLRMTSSSFKLDIQATGVSFQPAVRHIFVVSTVKLHDLASGLVATTKIFVVIAGVVTTLDVQTSVIVSSDWCFSVQMKTYIVHLLMFCANQVNPNLCLLYTSPSPRD